MNQRIIIGGINNISLNIGKWLISEGHDVVFISDSHDIDSIEQIDAQIIFSRPSSFEALKKAFEYSADIFLAFCENESDNFISCLFVKKFFDCNFIAARINNETHLQSSWEITFSDICTSFLCPEFEVAQTLCETIKTPGVSLNKKFLNEKIHFLKIRCKSGIETINTDFEHIKSIIGSNKISFLGVLRNNEFLLFDKKDLLLKEGDEVFILVAEEYFKKTLEVFGCQPFAPKKIIILGGGKVGAALAQEINENLKNTQYVFLEQKKEIAEKLSKTFPGALILNGSLIDLAMKPDAIIAYSDMLLSVTDDIQTNIIAPIFAHKIGIPNAITLVNESAKTHFYDILGIYGTLNPGNLSVSSILPFLSYEAIKTGYFLGHNIGTIVEVNITTASSMMGNLIPDLSSKGIHVMMISRNNEIFYPNEETILYLNDQLICFIEQEKTSFKKFLEKI